MAIKQIPNTNTTGSGSSTSQQSMVIPPAKSTASSAPIGTYTLKGNSIVNQSTEKPKTTQSTMPIGTYTIKGTPIARVTPKTLAPSLKSEPSETGVEVSPVHTEWQNIFGTNETQSADTYSTSTSSQKRKPPAFKMDTTKWLGTAGTTGTDRNRPEGEQYSFNYTGDAEGYWESGRYGWYNDNGARYKAVSTFALDGQYHDRDTQHGYMQEAANLYYDYGDMCTYLEGKLSQMESDIKNKSYSSEEDKIYDEAYIAAMRTDLDGARALRDSSKELYYYMAQQDEYMDQYDDYHIKDVTDPKNYSAVYKSEEYGDIQGGATPEEWEDTLTGLREIQKRIQGRFPNSSDPRAEGAQEEFRATHGGDTIDMAISKAEYALERAKEEKAQMEKANLGVVIGRDYFNVSDLDTWRAKEKELQLELDSIPETDAEGRKVAQEKLDYVHGCVSAWMYHDYYEKWKDASDEELINRIIELGADPDQEIVSIPKETPSIDEQIEKLTDQLNSIEDTNSEEFRSLSRQIRELRNKKNEPEEIETPKEKTPEEIRAEKEAEEWKNLELEAISYLRNINAVMRLESSYSDFISENPGGDVEEWASGIKENAAEKGQALDTLLKEKDDLSSHLDAVARSLFPGEYDPEEDTFTAEDLQKYGVDLHGAEFIADWDELEKRITAALDKEIEYARMAYSMARMEASFSNAYLEYDITQHPDYEEKAIEGWKRMGSTEELKQLLEEARYYLTVPDMSEVKEYSGIWTLKDADSSVTDDDIYRIISDYEQSEFVPELLDRAKERVHEIDPSITDEQFYEMLKPITNEDKAVNLFIDKGFTEDDAKEMVKKLKVGGLSEEIIDAFTPFSVDDGKLSFREILKLAFTPHWETEIETGEFSPQQISNYYYILATEGLSAATDYAIKVNNEYTSEYLAEMRKKMNLVNDYRSDKASGFERAVQYLSAPWATGIMNMTGVLDTLKYGDQIKHLGTHIVSDVPSLSEAADWITEDFNRQLTRSGASSVIQFLYNAYGSAVQSTEAMAIGSAIAGLFGITESAVLNLGLKKGFNLHKAIAMAYTDVAFFGIASSERYLDLIDRGVDPGKAMVSAQIYGVCEAFFEHFSLDKLYKAKYSIAYSDVKELVLQGLIGAGIEGSEEIATGLGNFLSDQLWLKLDGDFQQSIEAYKDQGFSPDEAYKKAVKDFAIQLSEEGAAGFLSGGMSIGFRMGTSYVHENGITARDYYSALGGRYADADFGHGQTGATALGKYLSNYQFIKEGEQSSYSEEQQDYFNAVTELAQKVASGNASNEDVGRLIHAVDNLDRKIIDDFIHDNKLVSWQADAVRAFNVEREGLTVLLGVEKANAYLDAALNNPDSFVVDDFVKGAIESGLSEQDAADTEQFLQKVLLGETMDENYIRNFISNQLDKPEAQLYVYNFLKNQSKIGTETAALITDTPTNSKDLIAGHQRYQFALGNNFSGDFDISNSEHQRILQGVLIDGLTTAWQTTRTAAEHTAVMSNALDAISKAATDAARRDVVNEAKEDDGNTELVKYRDPGDSVTIDGKTVTRQEYIAARKEGKDLFSGQTGMETVGEDEANRRFDQMLQNISSTIVPRANTSANMVKFDIKNNVAKAVEGTDKTPKGTEESGSTSTIGDAARAAASNKVDTGAEETVTPEQKAYNGIIESLNGKRQTLDKLKNNGMVRLKTAVQNLTRKKANSKPVYKGNKMAYDVQVGDQTFHYEYGKGKNAALTPHVYIANADGSVIDILHHGGPKSYGSVAEMVADDVHSDNGLTPAGDILESLKKYSTNVYNELNAEIQKAIESANKSISNLTKREEEARKKLEGKSEPTPIPKKTEEVAAERSEEAPKVPEKPSIPKAEEAKGKTDAKGTTGKESDVNIENAKGEENGTVQSGGNEHPGEQGRGSDILEQPVGEPEGSITGGQGSDTAGSQSGQRVVNGREITNVVDKATGKKYVEVKLDHGTTLKLPETDGKGKPSIVADSELTDSQRQVKDGLGRLGFQEVIFTRAKALNAEGKNTQVGSVIPLDNGKFALVLQINQNKKNAGKTETVSRHELTHLLLTSYINSIQADRSVLEKLSPVVKKIIGKDAYQRAQIEIWKRYSFEALPYAESSDFNKLFKKLTTPQKNAITQCINDEILAQLLSGDNCYGAWEGNLSAKAFQDQRIMDIINSATKALNYSPETMQDFTNFYLNQNGSLSDAFVKNAAKTKAETEKTTPVIPKAEDVERKTEPATPAQRPIPIPPKGQAAEATAKTTEQEKASEVSKPGIPKAEQPKGKTTPAMRDQTPEEHKQRDDALKAAFDAESIAEKKLKQAKDKETGLLLTIINTGKKVKPVGYYAKDAYEIALPDGGKLRVESMKPGLEGGLFFYMETADGRILDATGKEREDAYFFEHEDSFKSTSALISLINKNSPALMEQLNTAHSALVTDLTDQYKAARQASRDAAKALTAKVPVDTEINAAEEIASKDNRADTTEELPGVEQALRDKEDLERIEREARGETETTSDTPTADDLRRKTIESDDDSMSSEETIFNRSSGNQQRTWDDTIQLDGESITRADYVASLMAGTDPFTREDTLPLTQSQANTSFDRIFTYAMNQGGAIKNNGKFSTVTASKTANIHQFLLDNEMTALEDILQNKKAMGEEISQKLMDTIDRARNRLQQTLGKTIVDAGADIDEKRASIRNQLRAIDERMDQIRGYIKNKAIGSLIFNQELDGLKRKRTNLKAQLTALNEAANAYNRAVEDLDNWRNKMYADDYYTNIGGLTYGGRTDVNRSSGRSRTVGDAGSGRTTGVSDTGGESTTEGTVEGTQRKTARSAEEVLSRSGLNLKGNIVFDSSTVTPRQIYDDPTLTKAVKAEILRCLRNGVSRVIIVNGDLTNRKGQKTGGFFTHDKQNGIDRSIFIVNQKTRIPTHINMRHEYIHHALSRLTAEQRRGFLQSAIEAMFGGHQDLFEAVYATYLDDYVKAYNLTLDENNKLSAEQAEDLYEEIVADMYSGILRYTDAHDDELNAAMAPFLHNMQGRLNRIMELSGLEDYSRNKWIGEDQKQTFGIESYANRKSSVSDVVEGNPVSAEDADKTGMLVDEVQIPNSEDGTPEVMNVSGDLELNGKFSTATETTPTPKQDIKVTSSNTTKTTRTDANGNLITQTVRELRDQAFRNNKEFMTEQGEVGINKFNGMMDKVADWLTNTAAQKFRYLNFEEIENATLKVDPVSNQIILTSMVNNGEYEVNVDFGTICERRQALQTIMNELLEGASYDENGIGTVKLNASSIHRINEALRDAGINTQCLICFVETKRYNQTKQFTEFVQMWNSAVRKYKQNPDHFDFRKGVKALTEEEIAGRRKALSGYSAMKENGKDLSTKQAVEKLVKRLAEYSPNDLKLLDVNDIVSSKGRTNITETFPMLNTLILKKGGTSAPKAVYGFIPYNGEIESMRGAGNNIDEQTNNLRTYLKSIAGVRSQSFSDFIITHVFDHLQKTGGMAAVGLPGHTYTKVLARAKLFGLTGEKINMSLLFDIKPNVNSWYAGLSEETQNVDFSRESGRLDDPRNRPYNFTDYRAKMEGKTDWVQSFPYDDAVETQNTPIYSKNTGTIGVGHSYWHMKWMLADPEIRQTIGYHSSSYPAEIKSETKLDRSTDYTKVQNTSDLVSIARPNYKIPKGTPSYATPPANVKTGKGVAKKTVLTEAEVKQYFGTFANGTTVDLDRMFQAALKENKGKSKGQVAHMVMHDFLQTLDKNGLTLIVSKFDNGHSKFKLYSDTENTQNPYETSDNYLAWCLARNKVPMFYEFADDPNYYKNVYDFNVFDRQSYNPDTGLHEVYAPQEAVRVLDENGDLLFPNKGDIIADLDHYATQYDNEQHHVYDFINNEENMAQIKEIIGIEGKSSLDSDGTVLSEQQSVFFGQSEARDDNGNLLALYHGGTHLGYTIVDFSASDDGISYFLTDNIQVAKSYSGSEHIWDLTSTSEEDNKKNQELYELLDRNTDELSDEELARAYELLNNTKIRVASYNTVAAEMRESCIKYLDALMQTYDQNIKSDAYENNWMYDGLRMAMENISEELSQLKASEDSLFTHRSLSYDIFSDVHTAEAMLRLVNSANPELLGNKYSAITDAFKNATDALVQVRSFLTTVGSENVFVNEGNFIDDRIALQARVEAKKNTLPRYTKSGIYKVYANTTHPYVIDANGSSWRTITASDEVVNYLETLTDEPRSWFFTSSDPNEKRVRTRGLSRFAKDNGYDGVIIKNCVDMGEEEYMEDTPSTVVVVFQQDQVKDSNNRNPTHDPDMRYSTETEAEYVDTYWSDDTEAAMAMVEKAAKNAGYKKHAYHGTQRYGFNEFWEVSRSELGVHLGTENAARVFYEDAYHRNEGGQAGIYDVFVKMENTLKMPDVWGNPEALSIAVGSLDEWIEYGYTPRTKERIRWTKADSIKLKEALVMNEDFEAYLKALDDMEEVQMMFLRNPKAVTEEDVLNAQRLANQAARTYLINLGYDSIRYINEMEDVGKESYIILKPENIKRADPWITDDNGNLIPLSERFDNSKKDIRYSVDLKEAQFDIIENTNPAEDDIHTWIRSVDDIKTFEEALRDVGIGDNENATPDFTGADIRRALNSGAVTVYSKHPIENGTWVTPSKMEAQMYAGDGELYSRNVPLESVAWIDPIEGMYAETDVNTDGKFSIETLNNGMRYVQSDRKVIHGDDRWMWGYQMMDYVNNKIRNKQDVPFVTDDGRVVLITEDSAYKLKDPHIAEIVNQQRELMPEEDYERKLRTVAQIDELVTVAQWRKYRQDETGRHKGRVGEGGFNYYTAFYRDGDGKFYKVKITTGVKDGQEIVYSIGDISPTRTPREILDRERNKPKPGRSSIDTGAAVQPMYTAELPSTGETVSLKNWNTARWCAEQEAEKLGYNADDVKYDEYFSRFYVDDTEASGTTESGEIYENGYLDILSLKNYHPRKDKNVVAWDPFNGEVPPDVAVDSIRSLDKVRYSLDESINVDGVEVYPVNDNETESFTLEDGSEVNVGRFCLDPNGITTVTYFAGAGTLDYALKDRIFNLYAVEWDPEILDTFIKNNGNSVMVTDADVTKVEPGTVLAGHVDYFHASPVCKNFSIANNKGGEQEIDREFARSIVKALKAWKPKVFTLENVAGYVGSDSYNMVITELRNGGYKFDADVYKAENYGASTKRSRLFIRAVRSDVAAELPAKPQKIQNKTWWSAVEDIIPELDDGTITDARRTRLEKMGIDINNLSQPLLILSGTKGGEIQTAYANEPSPTLMTKGDEARIILTDGTIKKVSPHVYARIQGLDDDFILPKQKRNPDIVHQTNAFKIVGNGVPVQLTQAVVDPLLDIIDRGKASIETDGMYDNYQHIALVKPETLDYWLSDSGFGSTNPNYAQAYIGWMKPDNFLWLTTKNGIEGYGIDRIYEEGWYGDLDKISSNERSVPIQLIIDHETGQVLGHEGRHRMAWLRSNGVRKVPVLFFDSSNKYDKTELNDFTLRGQFNDEPRTNYTLVPIDRLIPLNNAHRDEIEKEFVQPTAGMEMLEKYGKPIARFSIDSPVDVYGDDVSIDTTELTNFVTSDLSDDLVYAKGNAYYHTPDGQTVVINDVHDETPEAEYYHLLENYDNANSTDTTTEKPYIIPQAARNESDGYNLREQDAGLRRGSEEVSAEYQEGTLRRAGSNGERNEARGSQSAEEESVRYSIVRPDHYNKNGRPVYKNTKGDYNAVVENEDGSEVTTADVYPIGSFEQQVVKAMADGDWVSFSKILNKLVGETDEPTMQADIELMKQIVAIDEVLSENEKKALYSRLNRLIDAYHEIKRSDKIKHNNPNFLLPNKTDDTHKVMRNLDTHGKNTNPDDELLTDRIIQLGLQDMRMNYVPQSNAESIERAKLKYTKEGSINNAMSYIDGLVRSGKRISPEDVALGEMLIMDAGAAKDLIAYSELVANMALLSHEYGQVLQAFQILRKLTPGGQLLYIQKVVDRLNEQYRNRIENPKDKMNKIVIPQSDIAAIMACKYRSELDAAMEVLKKHIAEQIPATWADKWNAWRYLAMLGNPRTHIRNFFGNGAFAPMVFLKDVYAREFEKKYIADGARNRIRGADLRKSSPYMKLAQTDWEAMKKVVAGEAGGNKYTDANEIQQLRDIFETGWLNKAAKANGEALGREDLWFMERYYKRAWAEFMQARGLSVDQVKALGEDPASRKLLQEARLWALNEAQRNTYHDANAIASTINSLKHKNGVSFVLLEGLIPFTKTPANILRRAIEYSPYGLVSSIIQLRRDLAAGRSVNVAIDRMAAGLSGTTILALGALLRMFGFLRGAGLDDPDEEKFAKLQGHQQWALEIPGVGSYTIDWMAPTALPLFIGSSMYDLFNSIRDKGLGAWNAWEFTEMMTRLVDPMLSLSMLDGIENTISSLSNAQGASKLSTLMTSMFLSYAAQGMPTIAGQLARSIDPARRSTYIDKNKATPATMQRFIQSSILSKIPGVESTKMAYVDEWGRKDEKDSAWDWVWGAFENFLSPGYGNRITSLPVDEELARLYAATGDKGVLPDAAAKYFNEVIDDESVRKELTADEYERLQLTRGQTAYSVISDLISTPEYAELSDVDRAKLIANAYTYADQNAKNMISQLYAEDKWVDLANKVGAVDYLLIKSSYDENRSNEKLFKWLVTNPNLNDHQIAQLIANKYNAPEEVSSVSAPGYVYEINDADEEAMGEIINQLVDERLTELKKSDEYRNANLEEQSALMADLWTKAKTDAATIYGQILDSNGRSMTIGKASALGKEAFALALDSYPDVADQSDWLGKKYNADHTLKNPMHDGYDLNLTPGQERYLEQKFRAEFDVAYAELNASKEFQSLDRKYQEYMVADLYNATAARVEEAYALELYRNNEATETFAETPSGYNWKEAYSIGVEHFDNIEDTAHWVAKKYSTGSTIANPDRPGYDIILTGAQQAEIKDDFDSIFVPAFISLCNSSEFKALSQESRENRVDDLRKKVTSEVETSYGKKLIAEGREFDQSLNLNQNYGNIYTMLATESMSDESRKNILKAKYDGGTVTNPEAREYRQQKYNEYIDANYDKTIKTGSAAEFEDLDGDAKDYSLDQMKKKYGVKKVGEVPDIEYDIVTPTYSYAPQTYSTTYDSSGTTSSSYVIPPAAGGTLYTKYGVLPNK